MDDAAVFKATYADWKIVKSRGVVQIVFEAPVENDAQILAVLGGMPRAAKERWFAIARLNTRGTSDATSPQPTTVGEGTHLKTPSTKGAARNSLTTRAAISCNAPQFRLFLEGARKHAIPNGCQINGYQDAHDVVCQWIGIQSLKELDTDGLAATKWDEIWGRYLVWKNADRYVEAPRIHEENKATSLST